MKGSRKKMEKKKTRNQSKLVNYANERSKVNSLIRKAKLDYYKCKIVEAGTDISKLYICSDRILTFGIRSIRSPAKVGLVVTDLITSPVVSWRGWETTPPPTPAHRLICHSLLNHG